MTREKQFMAVSGSGRKFYLSPDGNWIIWDDDSPEHADDAHRGLWYALLKTKEDEKGSCGEMRVFSAKKSTRGKKISCSSCSAKITPGEKYYFFFRRFSRRVRGSKIIKCSKHYPRPSELTSSKMGEVYDAQQDAQRAISDALTPSDIEAALRDVIPTAEDVKTQYEESLSNMPEQLQSAATGEEIQEKIDALDSFISGLESAADDVSGGECEHEEGTQEYDDWLADLCTAAETALEDLMV